MANAESWLINTPAGLYCAPGGFHVDPVRPVPKAVISHGHSDHARGGHAQVLATPETLAIMTLRQVAAPTMQPLRYREPLRVGEATVTLVPAGHVLGSAQVVIEHDGCRVVFSGDYKRRPDPTCAPFEPVRCDVFITEATFALPVFRHPDDRHEIGRLLHSAAVFPERCHLVGVYPLGKCQRLIALLRRSGCERPVYIHGGLRDMCRLYERHGIALGELRDATAATRAELRGAIVLAPTSALSDRWARRLPDPIRCLASGWMRIRARARQSGVELPLIISDHADWDELCETLDDVQAPRLWVTHGREEALVHAARTRGIDARALLVAGYEEDAA